MGTDVYLNWEGQTEEDKNKQYTGYSIDAGKDGYLRASVGMLVENDLLMFIFPDKLWESGEEGELFDFNSLIPKIMEIVDMYLSNKPFPKSIRTIERKEVGDGVLMAFEDLGFEVIKPSEDGSDIDKKMWANSLLNFIKLGAVLQNSGKSPRVYISY